MSYPVEWEITFRAKNGKHLHFRPEKASDTEMLWTMFSTLSEESVSNLIPPFTRERIEGWTSNIDYNKVLPILAATEDQDEQRIVASASLKFHPEEVFNHKAELGIVKLLQTRDVALDQVDLVPQAGALNVGCGPFQHLW